MGAGAGVGAGAGMSSAGAEMFSGAGAGAGMSSAGVGTSSVISTLLSEDIESETEEVSGFVGWTRSGENFLTELCRTKFLSSL